MTFTNKYPFPNIEKLFDNLQGARCFSIINLQLGYHNWGWKYDDLLMKALCTEYSHYMSLLMWFALTESLTMFIEFINRVVRQYLDMFVIVFIDDILIYLRSKNKHIDHLRVVIAIFKGQQSFIKFTKCQFF